MVNLLNYIYKPESELYNRINYTRNILLTGLLKSTLENSLMSIGFTLVVLSMVAPNQYCDAIRAGLVGAILILIGILVDFIGDRIKMELKDQELKHTEELAKEIAKEIAAEESKKNNEKLKDTLCNDPESLCNKEEE